MTLYFAEEEQFGKPNVTYDSTKKRVVATRVTAGVDNIDVTKAVSTDLAANDWVAIYSGDYQGVVQLMKVKSVSSKTITFDDNLQFPIAPNDTVEKVTNFNPKEIYPITGMVNFSPSLEIGQITSEASGAGEGGERVPLSPRRGNVNGDGGSLYVECTTEGFARLLRHAVGRHVDYSGLTLKTGTRLNTTINKAGGYSKGAKAIIVDALTNADVNDWILVGEDKLTAEPVKITKTTSGSKTIEFEPPLRFDHADDEKVREIDTAAKVLKKEIRKSNLPPAFTIYMYASDEERLRVISGCKMTSLTMNTSTAEETLKATFNFNAKAAQAIKGDLPFSPVNTVDEIPYTNPEVGVYKKGVRLSSVQSADITFENEVTTERVMDGTGTVSSAPEDIGSVEISFNALVFNSDRYDEAIAEAKDLWSIQIVYSGGTDGQTLEFYFPEAVISGNILPQTQGGGGRTAQHTLSSGTDDTRMTQAYVIVNSKEVAIS